MGINLEAVELLLELESKKFLKKGKCLELGRQDMFIPPSKLKILLATDKSVSTPFELYKHLGFESHSSIDGFEAENRHVIDLNKEISIQELLEHRAELVTNFGTTEHVFNQHSVFNNIHNLCSVGGVMVHSVPIAGNIQHGYYNYQPRMFQEMALINEYEILSFYIAADYWPTLIPYSKENLFRNRFRDLMLLVAFRKNTESPFESPFDGFFKEQAETYGYQAAASDSSTFSEQFDSFLVSGNWQNLNRTRLEVFMLRLNSKLKFFGFRTRFRSALKNKK